MKRVFENVIARKNYDLTALLERIDAYHIEGKLTNEEREALYAMARQSPVNQYDVAAEIEKLWAAVRALQNTESAGAQWGEFIQPTGAHNAYQTGAQITYNGKKYICLQDNCVWSPDVYPDAWELAE